MMDLNLITDPTVYLAASSQIRREEIDRFLEDHDVQAWGTDTFIGGEFLAEVAGRMCYMSFAKPRPGGNAAYLSHIKEVGHGSVLEHAVFSLIVTGISRSCSHEVVRHRAGFAYSQLSQRYVDESVAEYCVPPDLKDEVDAARAMVDFREDCRDYHKQLDEVIAADERWNKYSKDEFSDMVKAGEYWLEAVEISHEAYSRISTYLSEKAIKKRPDLVKTDARKFARQAARSVLPNATETKITMTANARAWRHFIEMRASKHADPEIRKLGVEICRVLQEASPNLFGDYALVDLPDGTSEAVTEHRKV
jgi:thymidylate synthase (FAD)